MRQFVVAFIVLGVAGCNLATGPRSTAGSGGDDASGTGGSGSTGGSGGGSTKTPTPSPVTETPAPIAASTAKFPYKAARFPMAVVDDLMVAPGGIFEPVPPQTRGVINNVFAMAKLTASGGGTTVGTWATASLPLRICDQELTVDHKKRLVMVGGVTQAEGTFNNSPIKDVYLGTVNATTPAVTWEKQAASALPANLSSFALATAADGKTHYVAGGMGPQGPVDEVLIGRSADDGAVTWTKSPNFLPSSRSGSAAVAANSRLYVIGGVVGSDRTRSVLAAQIKADGSLGTFAEVAQLPEGRGFMRAYVDKGNKIVVVGGSRVDESDSSAGTTGGTTKTVFVGRFDSSGTLTFGQAPSLADVSQHFGLALSSTGAIMAGGTRFGETKQFVDQVLQIPFN